MSDEKKLSFEDAKSAIESCYGFDDTTTPVGEAWAIVNDKIAALEQRLADAEANTQAAIDAALESVARYVESAKSIIPGHLMAARNEGLKDVSEFIRSRIGTNPLAERDARIAELESYIGYWEGSDITTADHIKQLEHELAEARKAAGPSFSLPPVVGPGDRLERVDPAPFDESLMEKWLNDQGIREQWMGFVKRHTTKENAE